MVRGYSTTGTSFDLTMRLPEVTYAGVIYEFDPAGAPGNIYGTTRSAVKVETIRVANCSQFASR